MRNAEFIDGNLSGRTVRRGFLGLVLLAVTAITAFSSTSCIRTGHVGVVTVFGRVTGQTMGEGIHLVNPIAPCIELDIRTLEIKEKRTSVPTKEGLIMGIEASVLYHLDPHAPPTCSQHRRRLRECAAGAELPLGDPCDHRGNSASSLYSDARESIARQILDDVRRKVAPAASSSRTSCCGIFSFPKP